MEFSCTMCSLGLGAFSHSILILSCHNSTMENLQPQIFACKTTCISYWQRLLCDIRWGEVLAPSQGPSCTFLDTHRKTGVSHRQSPIMADRTPKTATPLGTLIIKRHFSFSITLGPIVYFYL